MKTTVCAAFVVLSAIALRFAIAPSAAAQDAEDKIEIPVEEIGKKAVLIGRLGRPLGTMVTIQGKWALPDARVKDYSLRFTVTQVDDVKLEKPIEFNVAQIEAVDKRGESVIPDFKNHPTLHGKSWTLRAYETGRFHITPPEYYKALGIAPGSQQKPYWIRPFTSEIHGVLVPE